MAECNPRTKMPDLIRGADYGVTILQTENDAPIDLTGFELRMLLKTNSSDADGSAIADSIVTLSGPDAADGRGEISFTAAQLTGKTPGLYWLYLRLSSPDSPPEVQVLVRDRVELLA